MGSFYGVEVCKLVGLYLLNILKSDLVERISDCTEKTVAAVLQIILDLIWKKSKRIYVKFLKITI